MHTCVSLNPNSTLRRDEQFASFQPMKFNRQEFVKDSK
jgi:hypothetical protein